MTEQPGGVGVCDRVQLLRREVPEAPGDDGLRVGPGRVGMRIVGLDHDVIDPDEMPLLDR
jgi:hypothetical protein